MQMQVDPVKVRVGPPSPNCSQVHPLNRKLKTIRVRVLMLSRNLRHQRRLNKILMSLGASQPSMKSITSKVIDFPRTRRAQNSMSDGKITPTRIIRGKPSNFLLKMHLSLHKSTLERYFLLIKSQRPLKILRHLLKKMKNSQQMAVFRLTLPAKIRNKEMPRPILMVNSQATPKSELYLNCKSNLS